MHCQLTGEDNGLRLSWSTKVTDTSSVSGTVSRASAAIRPRVSFKDPSPSMILLSSANAASGSRLAPSPDDSTVIIAWLSHSTHTVQRQGVGPSCRERDAPHPTKRVTAWVNPLHPGPADDLLVRFPHPRATTALPSYSKKSQS